MRKLRFYDAYKEWRNRARKYDRESIVHGAVAVLCEPSPNLVTELQKFPWLTLLIVKWVCQDEYPGTGRSRAISRAEFDDLRQRLFEFPERLDRGVGDTMPLGLFMRQLVRPQLGFQRGLSMSFAREAALLAEQREDYPLRQLFKAKTGFDVGDFIDLSLATFSAVADGKRVINDSWFTRLQQAYTAEVVSSFQHSMSRSLPELVAFCGSLPDAKRKVASEYFEFPILTRYPFFRVGDDMICWHPAVFYRGLEGFVHSVLSEEGHEYMQRFGRLFEKHVVAEAKRVPTPFIDEEALRRFTAPDTQVPDGVLSFPGCNVFVESKTGLFDESVMSVGNRELFAHKTRAITKAVGQARATSVSLRQERRAPAAVLDAVTEYLLVVTNKDLGASRGTALASMYPEGTLDYPNIEAERMLPRDHIYVLTIDDFERLTNAAASSKIDLPALLASCVDEDKESETASHLFEQRLNKRQVPMRFSQVVDKAIDASTSRLERAFGG